MNVVEPAIQEATSELREALLNVVEPKLAPPFKPIDLHKTFGIDRRLGWELSRVIQDADMFSAARHYPGGAAIRRFLRAVKSGDATQEHIKRVEQAAERFESIVAEIGGDRERFDLLLASLSSADASEEMLAQRRAAFQANRYIYGAEVGTLLRTRILTPSPAQTDMVDIASVAGLVDLCRLRPGCEWPIYVRRWHNAEGESQGPTTPRSIEPTSDSDAPLIRSACNPPDIEVARVDVEPGLVEYVLPAGPVGQTGAVTCLVGEIFDAVGAAYAAPGDEYIDFNTRVATPAERIVVDTLIHRDLAAIGSPSVLLRNEIQRVFRGRQVWTDADSLEPLADVTSLGTGPTATGMVGARWYAPTISRVFEAAGLDPSAYALHRVTVPYPPMGATLTVRYRLPDEPTESG